MSKIFVFGKRKLERAQVIYKEGQESQVEKWLDKTGFFPIDRKTVHRAVFYHLVKKRTTPCKNPLGIIPNMALFSRTRLSLGAEYEIDYTARLYSPDQHRADEVDVEPSFGEVIPDFEDLKDNIEKQALDYVYKEYGRCTCHIVNK